MFQDIIISPFFHNLLEVQKPIESKFLGIYKSKLAASEHKIAQFQYCFLRLKELLKTADKEAETKNDVILEITVMFEAYLLFCKSSMDFATCAYWIYYNNSSNIDSMSQFYKKVKNGDSKVLSLDKWKTLLESIKEDDFFAIDMFLGDEKQSLRDLSIHGRKIKIITFPGENKLYFETNYKSFAEMNTWLDFADMTLFTILNAFRFELSMSEIEIAKQQ